jgi:uncharacterized membrane protein (UPF0127 family)
VSSRRAIAAVVAAALVGTVGAACASDPTPPASAAVPGAEGQPQTGLPRVPVTLAAESGELIVDAEVADSPDERRIGLMWRTSLGDKKGMLFLFPAEDQLSFWMKNTLIPLDMVFITAERKVLGVVEDATPRTTTSRLVPGLSQFVLELDAGAARQYGIRAGQDVKFFAPVPDR